jgi:uncharacterized protein YukE
MAINGYDAGTTLYTGAIATCITAGALSGNPIFANAIRTTTVLMGTLFSSPSDIDDAGEKWKEVKTQFLKAVKALEKADWGLSPEAWKNLGEKAYREAYKKFVQEAEKIKPLFDGCGQSLKQLAMLSMGAAIVCAAGAAALLLVSAIKIAGSLIPGFQLAWMAIQYSVSTAISRSILGVVKNNAMAMAVISGIVMAVSTFFSSLIGEKLSKAATPQNKASTPDVQQVTIEGLPMPMPTGLPGSSGMPSSSGMPGS